MSVSNVIAQVSGGEKKVLDNVTTVGDVKEILKLAANYQGAIDGVPADDSAELSVGDYVTFAEKVKGAAQKTWKKIVVKFIESL
jgi:hypothetical protein